MANTREIVDSIITGNLGKAQDLFAESVSESIKGIISEQKAIVAAEVFGTSVVEGCDDKSDKKDSDKDGDKEDDKDSDKEDKSDNKPPFGKKSDD